MNIGENNKNKTPVDDAGIRLAPTPLHGARTNNLPAVKQEFILQPSLEVEQTEDEAPQISSARDFQPKKKDINKRWKRSFRWKNFFVGVAMLLISALIILPYILGLFGIEVKFLPFKYVPTQFNAVDNIVDAFDKTVKLGWKGSEVNEIWLKSVPDIILAVGLLFIVFNLVKSVICMFGVVKPRKYLINASIYFLCVLALFIAALVGASAIGLEKIDFMKDFINGWKTSEFFTLLVLSAANIVFAIVCSLITPQRSGYTHLR